MSWTPEAIATEIRNTIAQLEGAVAIASSTRQTQLDAKRAWLEARAEERQRVMGEGKRISRDDRDDLSIAATKEQWKELDTADVAHGYARDVMGFLEKKLSALQTEARLIMLEYNAGGKYT